MQWRKRREVFGGRRRDRREELTVMEREEDNCFLRCIKKLGTGRRWR